MENEWYDEIKSKVVGKLKIGNMLPYMYMFLKVKDNFKCSVYHDYDFIVPKTIKSFRFFGQRDYMLLYVEY